MCAPQCKLMHAAKAAPQHSRHQLIKAVMFRLWRRLLGHTHEARACLSTCIASLNVYHRSLDRHQLSHFVCMLCLQDPSEEVACEVEGGAATARLAWKWTCLAAAAAAGKA
jgi:hypothetical protein